MGSFGNDLTEGIGHKGIPPEFQPRIALFELAFESDAIHNSCVNSIRNGMPTLNSPPRIELRGAQLHLLARMPADTGWIKNHLSAAERGDARSFGIPLVPADLHADAGVPGVEIGEAEIAGSEVKLFVV